MQTRVCQRQESPLPGGSSHVRLAPCRGSMLGTTEATECMRSKPAASSPAQHPVRGSQLQGLLDSKGHASRVWADQIPSPACLVVRWARGWDAVQGHEGSTKRCYLQTSYPAEGVSWDLAASCHPHTPPCSRPVSISHSSRRCT